jgi:hypothetical protein
LRTAEMVVRLLETHQTSVAILWQYAARRAAVAGVLGLIGSTVTGAAARVCTN